MMVISNNMIMILWSRVQLEQTTADDGGTYLCSVSNVLEERWTEAADIRIGKPKSNCSGHFIILSPYPKTEFLWNFRFSFSSPYNFPLSGFLKIFHFQPTISKYLVLDHVSIFLLHNIFHCLGLEVLPLLYLALKRKSSYYLQIY